MEVKSYIMKGELSGPRRYNINLSEEEAFELSQFISANCRAAKDGRPALETQIHNEMYEKGLQPLYKAKWKDEYDF